MALSLSNFLVIALAALWPSVVLAETRTFDWSIGWVNRNPDGLADRPVIGINGEWPLPLLNITKGDRVVFNIRNDLGNQSTSLHVHGMFQNGTTEMDGPVGVTQCDIPPGHNMTYNFTINQPGNYWYHSHTRGQYPDGFRGQLVINDPENPYRGMFDEEIAISLSDWYHDESPGLLEKFISFSNPTGAEPALMNDTQNLTVQVQPNKTYYLRIVNMAAFAAQHFWIEGHTMRIIDVDGVYTEPAEAEMLYISAAQRYGVLVTARNDTSANFAMIGAMDQDLFDAVPDGLNPNVTGWLMYDNNAAKPDPTILDEFKDFDDFTLVPQDGEALYDQVDHSFSLTLKMDNLGDGANYAFFNDITYTAPVVPTLYTALSSGDMANNVDIYGNYTNSFVLEKGQVVELILNNDDAGTHPFHLHGHNFQVAVRSDENWGDYDANNHTAFPAKPMRRDTLVVRPQSNFVIRWRADNPGVWMFHCHINWHLDSGLAAIMIEAPLDLQAALKDKIPTDHYDVCKAGGRSYMGNAAGNTVNLLDLSGQNEPPAPLPAGFTTKGIVALVFSVVAAFLGMAVIVWYGAAPLSQAEMASTQKYIAQHGVSTT